MKILLVGEFSGFFKNLKIGFEYLGHNVTLMAGSDGWKKIDGADISINSKLPSIFGQISTRLKYLLYAISISKFDIIIIVNPNIGLKYISKLFAFLLKQKSERIFLSACGTDVEYIRYGTESKFEYWPYNNCDSTPFRSLSVHKNIVNIVNGIIPTFYDYAEPWRTSIYKYKVTKTIPLCIDTKNIKTYYPKLNGKIVFFHGLNRECFKGTKYIRTALENMQKKYPDEIEVVIDGKMPLKDYLELMQRVDVVVDQCKAYSYGSMNSLYALSMGKVLMAGFRQECKNEYNLEIIPKGIIHIEPSIFQIEEGIEYLIQNKNRLASLGKGNRVFVEKYHDSKLIASKYIETGFGI